MIITALLLGAGPRTRPLAEALVGSDVVRRVLTGFGLDGGRVARPEEAPDLVDFVARNQVWLVLLAPSHAVFADALQAAGYAPCDALPGEAPAARAGASALAALAADDAVEGWRALGLPHAPPPEQEELEDCVACTACCYSLNPRYVDLSPADLTRMRPEERERLVAQVQGAPHLRLEGTRCAALGPDGACTIYERRPQRCRDFPRGGAGCTFARSGKKLAGGAVPDWWPWPAPAGEG